MHRVFVYIIIETMSVKEVANIAGVSNLTVYRVIKNDPVITHSTAEKVRKAMTKIGYVPRARKIGKNKSQLKHDVISLIYCMGERDVGGAYLSSLLHGVEAGLTRRGINMNFIIMASVAEYNIFPNNIKSRKVDGIILAGQNVSKELEKNLRGIPVVWVGPRAFHWGDAVMTDCTAAGRCAASYVLEKGHRNAVFINPIVNHLGFGERGDAFASSMKRASGHVEAIVCDNGEPSFVTDTDAIPALHKLVEQYLAISPRPRAIFIPAVVFYAPLCQLLIQNNIDIERDVDIVTCGDLDASNGFLSKPATVGLFPEKIGRQAVESLLWRINNFHEPFRTVSIEPRLAN